MAEIHVLVVIDSDTRKMRVADMTEAPVDSDEVVWDADEDEWRQPTGAELDLLTDSEGLLSALIDHEPTPRERAAALLTDTDIAGILAGMVG